MISEVDIADMKEDSWKQAVDDALVSACLDCSSPDDNPREIIRKLIAWEVQMALDPAVSSDAQKLFNAGYNQAVRDAMNGELDTEGYLDV